MSASSKIKVLVVEDEALIRLDFVSRLADAGFEPLEAGSAAAALEMLESNRDIRVVFTDVRMPGDMDGIELARAVRKRWPPTLIVVCSANLADVNVDLADIHLLDKPYVPDRLKFVLDAVSAELARH